MNTIIKYVADDGTEFSQQKDCLEYENLAEKIKDIMSALPSRPSNTDFSNGRGYIQHQKTAFNKAKKELIDIVADWFGVKHLKKEKPENVHPMCIIGRYIDDSGNRAMNSAWYRIQCTDSQYREWGQPYYAAHPKKMPDVHGEKD